MPVPRRTTMIRIAAVAAVGAVTACSAATTPASPSQALTLTSGTATFDPTTISPDPLSVTGGTGSAPSSTAKASSSAAPAPSTAPPAATESNPAGDIPDTQAFVDYTPPGGGYTVKVPEGWARADTGRAVVFSDKYNSITIDTTAAASAPTTQSAQTELTALATTTTGFAAGTVTTVQRTAGAVLLLTYRADSAVNAVTGKVVSQDVERYEFWSSDRLVTLTLAAPVGSDNVDPWRTVTDSLRWSA